MALSDKPLAKPSGILLSEHENHVWEQAIAILKKLPFLEVKYNNLIGKDLSPSLERAIIWHDKGKRYFIWQEACQKDYQLYRNWRLEQGLDSDDLNAKDFKQYETSCLKQNKSSAPNLLKAGLRHEFASLTYAERSAKQSLSWAEQTAIAAHHGKLHHKHEHRWKNDGNGFFYEHWKRLDVYSTNVGRKWLSTEALEKSVLLRFEFSAIRTLLQLADTRASREEGGGKLPTINSFTYDFPHTTKDGGLSLRSVQQSALDCPDSSISVLRAPTGSGKTDASLLWAKKQILGHTQKADRLVIAMPTRFTSNALAINIEESVSDTGLYHSSAWFTRFGTELTKEKRNEAVELHKLAQRLATPVSVCTIDHLLMCLTGTQEVHHSTFYFLANAAVVFDEVDFYDPFIQANIKVLLDVLKILKVPVLIMSATVPDSALKFYGINTPIIEPDKEVEPDRSLQLIGNIAKPTIDSDLPEIVTNVFWEMIEAGNGIVYANTTLSGLAYYNWFKANAPSETPVVFYHSRFTEPDKKKKEKYLIELLGKTAWKVRKAGGIAIMTQIGEMSINVCSQIMYSELCPWDRLAQRIGRLSRFEQVPAGICYIAIPTQEGDLYPAPYGTLKGGKWHPGRAILDTLNRIDNLLSLQGKKQFTSEDFVTEVNRLYPSPEKLTSYEAANQQDYRRLIQDNWMIVPHTMSDEDNAKASNWKARDMMKQETFMIAPPDSSDPENKEDKMSFPFPNYEAVRSYQLEYGVSCPNYLIRNAEKLGQIVRFPYTIGDDTETHHVHIVNCYNPDIGLAELGIETKNGSGGGSAKSNRIL